MLVVGAVVVVPPAFISVTYLVETLAGDRTEDRVEVTAARAADALARLGIASAQLNAEFSTITGRWRQRVRVLEADGGVLADANQIVGHSLLFSAGDLIYGPDRIAVLEGLEASEGPLQDRSEVVKALRDGTSSRCWQSIPGNLYLCAAARRVEIDGAPHVVHVIGSSRRALQTLYESRRQLLKVTGFALIFGLALAWWMGRRIVEPVEKLRDQLLERAHAAAPRAGLAVDSHDELGDLAGAFNALLAALVDRSRANEAFLADLAHEFKNPVAAIRACAERLADHGALDAERARRLSEVLHRSSIALDSLVTQFLELAKAEAGLPTEIRERVELGGLLRGLVTALSIDERYRQLTIVCKGDAGVLPIEGVSARLETAFRNLLDNAASFAGEGGRVTVEVKKSAEWIEVSIADTGPGIAPEHMAKIFDRFFTTRGDRHGTGLGLALTRAVVEAHQGTIRAEPAQEGAHFVVRLPLASAS